jgi:hypothetical protein
VAGTLSRESLSHNSLTAPPLCAPNPQDKALAAEQNYTLLRERNQSELARLNLTCADDFRRALGRFAAVQAAAAATAADVWRGVAEQFASPAAAAGSEGAGNSA